MASSASRKRVGMAAAACALALLAACSTSGSDAGRPAATSVTGGPGGSGAPGGGTTVVARPFDPAAVAKATVQAPPTAGKGNIVLGPGGAVDLASVGYEQNEVFFSGTATSYTSDTPLTSDGQWKVRSDASASYTSRMVVRRPSDPAKFNGTVYVEWLNVTGGLDTPVDWTLAHVAMTRAGAVYVGVTAQVVGIDGGGGPGAILALKTADPERYGSLSHPGDDFSYDMYSQAGAAVRTQSPAVLGGLTPARVIATGESQSASRLTTYVNALAPTTRLFDAYFLHSRGAGAAPLSLGTRVSTARGPDAPQAKVPAPNPTLVRGDLGLPVMVFSSETDVLNERLGYRAAYQPDTQWFRSWEVPGTAHLDAYGLGIGDRDTGNGAGDAEAFAAMSNAPSKVYFDIISCDAPINAGPHTYVDRAALIGLDDWVRTGTPPPSMPRMEVDAAGTAYVVDGSGNVKGGIRTPHLDVPIAKLSGSGQSGDSFCFLFGTTVSFDANALKAAYPDHATFVDKWNRATDAAVKAKAILPEDGERLKAVAADSSIGR